MTRAPRRFVTAVLAAALCFSITTPTYVAYAPAAMADEVDDLVKELDELSKIAEEKTEEYKDLEDTIRDQQEVLARTTADAERLRLEANEARTGVVHAKGHVDQLAQAKYREVNTDPITEVMTADGPQSAIDRAAYISALAKRSDRVVTKLDSAVTQAAVAADEAARAKAQAEFSANQLQARREKLDEERKELTTRTTELKERIDALNAEERARWAAKNDPEQVPDDVAPVPSNDFASDVVRQALSKVGAPYSWGSAGPSAFDCSGLMVWAFKQIGKNIPRTSQGQMRGGTPVPLSDIQPGDIVGYYSNASHVGLYIGGGKIVHSSDYGIPVQVVSLRNAPIYGVRRY